ncbi:hypothetical protein EUX98_g4460 [Antrodiella citrinella]|uniref:Uncharacterized protein n=1 Tax=Antrodiella citrinella TaxID=2447956 RepID=A0A4S4MUU8_9APHY|nr:hypothetical protein EUX98_g4460 [Antrodiella citrinella]
MDEVIHHCLRELAFDGDLGCAVSRLRDFVSDFYTSHPSSQTQTLDDAFYAFCWSVIVQQPGVRVGKLPVHTEADVSVAPDEVTRRKRGVKQGLMESVESLELIPDASLRSLDDLVVEHGDQLRIAVEPDKVSMALIGSHIRPTKLTPPVFAALQLVAQGRDAGMSTVELSNKTGYDAKTCFYLVLKLLELNLVEKRKKGGIGTHVIIHKYFFDRSPFWQGVIAEEAEAADVDMLKAEIDADEEAADLISPQTAINFEPIDLRFLTSLPIVRTRVVKLLLASPHNTHPAQNIMTRMGFMPGTKTDRRFFLTRMRELMAQGVLEKVQVPSPRNKSGFVTCFRLMAADGQKVVDEEVQAGQGSENSDEDVLRLKGNESLHRQIIDLIDASGTEGTTTTALSQALCGFDRRIVELLLTRLEQYPPPPHLADLGICQLQETSGRERRFKYFTMANFHIVGQKENMSSAYLETDLSHAGEFLAVDDDQFYEDDEELNDYVDTFQPHAWVGLSSSCKTPRKSAAGKAAKKNPEKTPKRPKTPKPPKPPKQKNPTLPDGTVKKGRPRKYARGDGLDGEAPLSRGKKRKREEDPAQAERSGVEPVETTADAAVEPPPKKRRGRPPKAKPGVILDDHTPADTNMDTGDMPPTPTPKTRGKKGMAGEELRSRRTSRRVVLSPDGDVPESRVEDGPSDSAPAPPLSVVGEGSSAAADTGTAPLATTTEAQIVAQLSPLDSAVTMPRQEVVADPEPGIVPSPAEQPDLLPHAPPSPPEVEPEASGSGILIDPALFDATGLIAFDTTADGITSGTEETHAKRPPSPTPENPSKRARTVGPDDDRVRGNISQARRDKEFLQVITEAGGLYNISGKEFTDSHATLVDRLMKEGEPVSSRNISARADKRTVDATLNSLESRGKIKQVNSVVTLSNGNTRRIKVAYLPEVSEEELGNFLADVGRTILPFGTAIPLKTLEVSLTYRKTPSKTPAASHVAVLERHGDGRNGERAEALLRRDDESIRESLLTEKDTIAQLYGFIPGKALRARFLHLLSLELFSSADDTPTVVSKSQRIINLSYYHQDISVTAHCSLVACLEVNEELATLLSSPQGPRTALSNLPETIKHSLRLTKTRSVLRILDLLDVLHALGLVTPLRPSSSENPSIRVDTNGVHPTAFDALSEAERESYTSPQYWQFTTIAPLFFWVLKDKPARFWKEVPVSSVPEAELYWRELEFASTNQKGVWDTIASLSQLYREANLASNMIRLLRRQRSWSTSYNLSYFQIEYLRKFIDVPAKTTPLQDLQDGAAQVEKIAFITSTPVDVIRNYYEQEFFRMTHESEKLREKSKKPEEKKADKKASLAQKAASAKQQREKLWDDMVAKVHPEPLKGSAGVRVRRVRARFLQSSGTGTEKWEEEIAQAIEEAKIAATKILTAAKPVQIASTSAHASAARAPPPQVTRSTVEKSVETIVAQQGPALIVRGPQKKKKGAEESTEKDVRRRHRFQWNRDYDELARDASAIIKARCRDGTRLDWAALEQVFPAVPRNSVRQRVGSLKEQAGGEAFMKRLEDKWYELWLQHRGTDALPDPDPESASNFDIIAHVKFLRNHVDKTALRIGLVETESTIIVHLPQSVAEFEDTWQIVEKGPTAPAFDFMWTLPSEETREKQFLQQAFLSDANDLPPLHSYSSEPIHVADATVKMALGSPNDVYDSEQASILLKSVGETSVQLVTADLLERGVLSKVVRDPAKAKPGKTLRISEMNQNALSGSFSTEIYQDALSYDEYFSKDKEASEWREWSLLATDGDTAALVELVSENKIELKIETSGMKFANSGVDWNSKKIDDDDIETAILVRSTADAPSRPTSEAPPDSEMMTEPTVLQEVLQEVPIGDARLHGQLEDGSVAACRTTSSGPVDCEICLKESVDMLCTSMEEQEASVTSLLLSYLTQAASSGLTKSQLLANFDDAGAASLPTVITHLTSAPIPAAFWTGYGEIALVSSAHLKSWSAVTSQGHEDMIRVFPRRWLDLYGRLVQNVWKAALKAVMGVIVFRPGLTQAEIRWRLRSVYDRQEINEVLQHLLVEGQVKKHVEAHDVRRIGCGPPDNIEESMTFWTVGEKHWYLV